MTDKFGDDQIARLNHWVEIVESWLEGLEQITANIRTENERLRTITDADEAAIAGVDLVFVRNRIEHMINVWLGQSEDEG